MFSRLYEYIVYITILYSIRNMPLNRKCDLLWSFSLC